MRGGVLEGAPRSSGGGPKAAGRSFPRRASGLASLVAGLVVLPVCVSAQRLEVTPDRDSATVGDIVPLTVRWYPHPQDVKLAPSPEALEPLPEGFRLAGADSLVRSPDGTWRGKLYVAFYRPGSQVLPPFRLPFRRGAAMLGGGVVSEPGRVEIVPTLGGGSPSLRDIKEIEPPRRPPWLALAAVLAVAAAGSGAVWWVRRRAPPAPAGQAVLAPAPRPDPYRRALARLAELEDGSGGAVDRHYEAVLDVLRDYLGEAQGLPARCRTSAELLGALPLALAGNGLTGRVRTLLGEADLVKFAGVRPGQAAAARFLAEARAVLDEWHRSSGAAGAPRAAG